VRTQLQFEAWAGRGVLCGSGGVTAGDETDDEAEGRQMERRPLTGLRCARAVRAACAAALLSAVLPRDCRSVDESGFKEERAALVIVMIVDEVMQSCSLRRRS